MKKIWLIGATQMAVDYSKVLDGLGCEYDVITRGEKNAAFFTEKTGHHTITGGLEKFLSTHPLVADYAIVAVGVENLNETTNLLIDYGVKRILVEKPGGLSIEQIEHTIELAENKQTEIFVGYNRRFYASTLRAKEIIEHDGGVTSFSFEFTEWAHVIDKIDKNPVVKKNWFLANSTHVVDMAFYIGGIPSKMSCYSAGELDWHKPAIYSGSGVTTAGALFSYQANWSAPGRWSVEMLTKQHRLIFKPLETLCIQKIGSVAVEQLEIDNKLDQEYKPGLYRQVEAFITGNTHELLGIKEHLVHWEQIYIPILNSL